MESKRIFSQLLGKVKKNNPQANLEKIKQAYKLACLAHQGQKRLSGEDYIIHPVKVAYMLASHGLDETTICAALLHDVLEDTAIKREKIVEQFGEKVAELIEGVTKLKGLRHYSQEGQVENLRKMFLAMAADIRVVLIRLFDRLHNLQTLEYLPPEKRKRIAKQTLEIYAPLADQLGMGELRGQLEDLAFKYYQPREYQKILKLVMGDREAREVYVKKVIKYLKKRLKDGKVKFIKMDGRVKHLYSLYKKIQRYQGDLSKIYDLEAIRIITDSVANCYRILGIIHSDFKPLLGRIKDYIALPKPNGYRSLHTTVFCLEGKIIEIQIKTLEMHEEAEWGIAAHWRYKEDGGGNLEQKGRLGSKIK